MFFFYKMKQGQNVTQNVNRPTIRRHTSEEESSAVDTSIEIPPGTPRLIDRIFYPHVRDSACVRPFNAIEQKNTFVTQRTICTCLFNNYYTCGHYTPGQKYDILLAGFCPYHSEMMLNMRMHNICLHSEQLFLPVHSSPNMHRYYGVMLTTLVGGSENPLQKLEQGNKDPAFKELMKLLLSPHENVEFQPFTMVLTAWAQKWWDQIKNEYRCLREMTIPCCFKYDTFLKFMNSTPGQSISQGIDKAHITYTTNQDGISTRKTQLVIFGGEKSIQEHIRDISADNTGTYVMIVLQPPDFNILDQLILYSLVVMNFNPLKLDSSPEIHAVPNVTVFDGYLVYGSGFGFSAPLNNKKTINVDNRIQKYIRKTDEEIKTIYKNFEVSRLVDVLVLNALRKKEAVGEGIPVAMYGPSSEITNLVDCVPSIQAI